MPRPSSRLIYSDFSSGEMSPDASARVDIEATFKGCSEITNFYVRQLGGVERRPGSMFVNEVKDSDKKVRLFHYDTVGENHYVIELGDLYMRFYLEDGSVVESSPGVPAEIVTPWTEDQLHEIQSAQLEDIMFFVHPDVHPKILTRTDATTFVLADYDHVWGPFLDVNIDTAWTMSVANLSIPAGTVTITASQDTFEAGHVGTQFYLTDGSTTGYVLILTFVSPTVVTAIIVEPIPARVFVTSLWAEQAWSSIYGYPSTVAFFQQRAWWAGVKQKPQLIWGSVVADYTNFALAADDDAAVTYRVTSDRREEIVWLAALGKELYIGSEHSLMEMSGGDGAITPSNVSVNRASSTACHGIKPIPMGNRAVFVDRSQTKLMMFQFDRLSGEQHVVENLNLFANHIGDQVFKEIAWAQDPLGIFFAATEAGKLVTCTLYPEQGMVAWAQQDVGGGFVESVVSSHANGYEIGWLVVKRTIDGVVKRYIERISGVVTESIRLEYVDSALYYVGVATDTITGLEHLEGETVTILADEASHPPKTVVSGEITLDYEATDVVVGLEAECGIRPNPLDSAEAPLGGLAGLPRGYGEIYLRLVNSMIPLVELDQSPVRSPDDLMDTVPPLVTEDLQVNVEGFEPGFVPRISATIPKNVRLIGMFARSEFGVR